MDGRGSAPVSTYPVPEPDVEHPARSLLDGSIPFDPSKARDLIRALLVQVHKQRIMIEVTKIGSTRFELADLLRIMVSKSTEVVDADRSALFLVDAPNARLWSIVAEGLTSEPSMITMPAGAGIVGHVAKEGEQVTIHDAYGDSRFNRSVDMATGYQTRNLVATPLFAASGRVLGVLEVINKKTGTFTAEDAENLVAFASAAAPHIETAQLYKELAGLFDSFIDMIALAVDERDPCTAGHSRRVKIYSRALGEAVNRVDSGSLARYRFSDEGLRQLEIAALLHDVGKVGVRENVLNKRNRLTDEALKIICQRLDLELTHRKLETLALGKNQDSEEEIEVGSAIAFIRKTSAAGMLSTEEARRLWEIRERGWLDDCEYEHLAVMRGNLTPSEWEHMQSHVTKSHQLLSRIAWPEKFHRVPEIAYCHHEKLNGKGYPRGLDATAIPIEAQIVTVADIYDALTAHDRPYKPPMPHEKAAAILTSQARDNFLNQDVVELFLGQKLHLAVTG